MPIRLGPIAPRVTQILYSTLFLFALLWFAGPAHADQVCDTLLNPTTSATNSAGTPACIIQGQTSSAAPITYDTVDNSNSPVSESVGNVIILASSSGGDGTSNWAGVAVFSNNASNQGTIQLFTTAGTNFSTFSLGPGYQVFVDEGSGGMTLYEPSSEEPGVCGDGETDCYLFDISASTSTGGGTATPEPGTMLLLGSGLAVVLGLSRKVAFS